MLRGYEYRPETLKAIKASEGYYEEELKKRRAAIKPTAEQLQEYEEYEKDRRLRAKGRAARVANERLEMNKLRQASSDKYVRDADLLKKYVAQAKKKVVSKEDAKKAKELREKKQKLLKEYDEIYGTRLARPEPAVKKDVPGFGVIGWNGLVKQMMAMRGGTPPSDIIRAAAEKWKAAGDPIFRPDLKKKEEKKQERLERNPDLERVWRENAKEAKTRAEKAKAAKQAALDSEDAVEYGNIIFAQEFRKKRKQEEKVAKKVYPRIASAYGLPATERPVREYEGQLLTRAQIARLVAPHPAVKGRLLTAEQKRKNKEAIDAVWPLGTVSYGKTAPFAYEGIPAMQAMARQAGPMLAPYSGYGSGFVGGRGVRSSVVRPTQEEARLKALYEAMENDKERAKAEEAYYQAMLERLQKERQAQFQ